MKTPFILLSLLFAELLCAQQPRIMLQTNSADYFAIEGKAGEKFYDQVKTINDFDIELYYEILNDPKRDIRDWSITGFGTGLCQYEIYEDSIVGFNPLKKDSVRPGFNIHEFSYKDGIIRFQSTQKFKTIKGEIKTVTIYTWINPNAKTNEQMGRLFSVYMIEFFKIDDKRIWGNVTYVSEIAEAKYRL
jgi:hypothetical protein